MNNTPGELFHLISQVFDPSWEPVYEAYAPHLAELNRITFGCGVPVEGNLFIMHLSPTPPELPEPAFRPKRRNFALFATSGSSLLEVGFNAGHSALLALSINQDLVYTGIDIDMHAYTRPCYEYLRTLFGDRIRLHFGDSREVLPVLRRGPERYDLYHLDGGHGFSIAHSDLCNMLEFAEDGETILVDDTNHADIDAMCDYYVMQGDLTRIEMPRLWTPTDAHRLFRMRARR